MKPARARAGERGIVSRPILVALTVLLGALALLGPLGQDERRSGAPRGAGADGPIQLAEPPGAELVPAPVVAEGRRHPGEESPERSQIRAGRAAIVGRVVLEGGLPAGASVLLKAEVHSVCAGQPVKSPELVTAVAPSGRFELSLPVDAEYALLDVDASFLKLEKRVRAEPGERGVVLAPVALASIAGRVFPPPGTVFPSAAADFGDVTIQCLRADGRAFDRSFRASSAVKASNDGTFETLQLPAGVELCLNVSHPLGPPWKRTIEPLAPGELRRVVVELDTGARVSGLVVDEHGAAVAHLAVTAVRKLDPANRRELMTAPRRVQTDGDGRFELAGLERSTWQLSTAAFGLADGAGASVDATQDDVAGVVLAIRRGLELAGTVTWPDGRPAERFEIEAEGLGHVVHTRGTGGSFCLSGLTGPMDLEVSAAAEGVRGRARVASVVPGGAPVALVLELTP